MADTMIQDAVEIYFKIAVKTNNQLFGDLNLATTTKARNINLTNVLLKTQQAMLQPNFLTVLNSIKTNKVPRHKNNQNVVILKFHENRTHDYGPTVRPEIPVIAPDSVADSISVISEPVLKGAIAKVQRWTENNEKITKQQLQRDVVEDARPILVSAYPENPQPLQRKGKSSCVFSNFSKHDFFNIFLDSTLNQQVSTIEANKANLKKNLPRRPQGSMDGVQKMLRENLSLTNVQKQDTVSIASSTTTKSAKILERLRMSTASSKPKSVSTTSCNFIPAGCNTATLHQKKKDEPKMKTDSEPSHNNNGRNFTDDSSLSSVVSNASGTTSKSAKILERLQMSTASSKPKSVSTNSCSFIPAGCNTATLQQKKKDEPKMKTASKPSQNNNGRNFSDDSSLCSSSVVNDHQQNGHSTNERAQQDRRANERPGTSYQKALENERW
jgi:hypothetical protein